MIPHCTRKVIGGELQERLIPVPYSKTSTDQAVRFQTKPALSHTSTFFLLFSLSFVLFFYLLYSTTVLSVTIVTLSVHTDLLTSPSNLYVCVYFISAFHTTLCVDMKLIGQCSACMLIIAGMIPMHVFIMLQNGS